MTRVADDHEVTGTQCTGKARSNEEVVTGAQGRVHAVAGHRDPKAANGSHYGHEGACTDYGERQGDRIALDQLAPNTLHQGAHPCLSTRSCG